MCSSTRNLRSCGLSHLQLANFTCHQPVLESKKLCFLHSSPRAMCRPFAERSHSKLLKIATIDFSAVGWSWDDAWACFGSHTLTRPEQMQLKSSVGVAAPHFGEIPVEGWLDTFSWWLNSTIDTSHILHNCCVIRSCYCSKIIISSQVCRQTCTHSNFTRGLTTLLSLMSSQLSHQPANLSSINCCKVNAIYDFPLP